MELQLTWFGHSAVRLDYGNLHLMLDPFLSENPSFNGDVLAAEQGVTHILLSHGHDDHVGDTVAMAARNAAPVVAMVELCDYLARQGVQRLEMMNYGGSLELGAVDGQSCQVTFVPAWHSSAKVEENGELVSLGQPAGLVIRLGAHTVYFAGDTCIFSDMGLIDDLYQPTVGLLPIGGRFTMDGPTAAIACREFFDFKTVVPLHYGTFPLLAPNASGFVQAMAEQASRVQVLQSGQTITIAAPSPAPAATPGAAKPTAFA